jgi:hypothetical protein
LAHARSDAHQVERARDVRQSNEDFIPEPAPIPTLDRRGGVQELEPSVECDVEWDATHFPCWERDVDYGEPFQMKNSGGKFTSRPEISRAKRRNCAIHDLGLLPERAQIGERLPEEGDWSARGALRDGLRLEDGPPLSEFLGNERSDCGGTCSKDMPLDCRKHAPR